MADAPPPEGKDFQGPVIAAIIAAFLLFALFGGFSLSGSLSGESSIESSQSSIANFFSTDPDDGEMQIGNQVINKQVVQVRRQAASTLIGEQAARTTGTILEGPVFSYGKQWWRVDYSDAPDGWVDGDSITTRVGTFRAYNIFPIVYQGLLPILGIFCLILIVIYFILIAKRNSLSRLKEQKEQLIEEEYQEKRAYVEPVGPTFTAGVEGLPVEQAESSFDPASFVGAPQGNSESAPKVPKNKRWEYIQQLRQSPNVNDWRQAVLESDIILEQILDKIGYEGKGVGEKLKAVPKGDMININQAWEAHKARNVIAHSGAEYPLSRQEIDQILKNYEQVFREYYYI